MRQDIGEAQEAQERSWMGSEVTGRRAGVDKVGRRMEGHNEGSGRTGKATRGGMGIEEGWGGEGRRGRGDNKGIEGEPGAPEGARGRGGGRTGYDKGIDRELGEDWGGHEGHDHPGV